MYFIILKKFIKISQKLLLECKDFAILKVFKIDVPSTLKKI